MFPEFKLAAFSFSLKQEKVKMIRESVALAFSLMTFSWIKNNKILHEKCGIPCAGSTYSAHRWGNWLTAVPALTCGEALKLQIVFTTPSFAEKLLVFSLCHFSGLFILLFRVIM